MDGTFSVGNLALGKPVVGSDGESIGVVNELVENPSAPPGSAGSFYMKVSTGKVFGLGGTELYVPVTAVAQAPHDEPVVLICTAEEARERFREKP